MPARPKSSIHLLGLRIRGRRRGGTVIRGVLRRGGCFVRAIRGAAGNKSKGDDGNAGGDDFLHKWNVGLLVN